MHCKSGKIFAHKNLSCPTPPTNFLHHFMEITPIDKYKTERSATQPRYISKHAGVTRKVLLYLRLPYMIWKASFEEALTCEREPDSASDRYPKFHP